MLVPKRDGSRFSEIYEIYENFDVSKTHLLKVVSKLGHQRYIEPVRGRCGGIGLGRPPAQIGVAATMRGTEDALAVMDDSRQDIALPFKRRGRRPIDRLSQLAGSEFARLCAR